jgi:uncharacterized short protein YbdD (DUF466 family)
VVGVGEVAGQIRSRRRLIMTGAGAGTAESGTADGVTVRPGVRVVLMTAARGVRWWISSVMGDNAYARYVEHLANNHPDDPVPSEREYWRERHAAADANPGARCC